MWNASTPPPRTATATATATNLSAAVTQLRFIHADPGGRRGRRLVPHKVRRGRSLVTGRELQGNLHTLGYFSAYICAGTPQSKFDLIVDTGSSLTAMPCKDCSHCGSHRHSSYQNARFDTTHSSSYQQVSCHSPPRGMGTCRSCDKDQCGYSVSYTEGSTIRGRIVSDYVWFASAATGTAKAVRCTFGCQTYESGLFNSQVADGITGISQGQSYGPTLFDWMRTGTSSPDVFSMCLSETVGAMVLGGNVPASLAASTQWIPYSGGGSYTVDLVDIRIKGSSLGVDRSRYRSTIVDSGTTFMYLPPDAYRKVRDHWRGVCPWGSCSSRVAKGEYPDDYCYSMSEAELVRFDDFSLHMNNGVTIPFGPRQYGYELRGGVWCLGIFDNEHNGAVIGGANMRNNEVIFDRAHRRIAFVPSDCGAMHAGARGSYLEGGYGLSGCGTAGFQTPGSPGQPTSPMPAVRRDPPPPPPRPPPKPRPPPPKPPPSPKPPPPPSPPPPSPPPPSLSSPPPPQPPPLPSASPTARPPWPSPAAPDAPEAPALPQLPMHDKMPAKGVLVLDGGHGNFAKATCVTDPTQTTLGDKPIAVQCCDQRTSACRRHTGGPDAPATGTQSSCVGGWGYEATKTGELVPATADIQPATFSRAVWECQRRGLRLCHASCAGAGCGYDALPVWTGLLCPDDGRTVEEHAKP